MTSNEPRGPVDSSRIPRYAGPATFARLPRLDEVGAADVAVVGVPFDSGVSYRPGARFGGNAIREASRLLRPYNPAQDASPFALAQVADAGDIAVNPFDINEAVETVAGRRRRPAGHRRPPDDARRRPHHRAAAAALGRPQARPGRPAALRRAPRHLGHLLRRRVHPRHALPPRGRGGHPRHLRPLATSAPAARSTAARTSTRTPGWASASSPRRTSCGAAWTRSRSNCASASATDPLYISIDIDVLDPAHAPGTGTPEAGGLTSRELLEILRGLSSCHLVSADLVEVAPAYDHAEITSVAASHTAYELTTIMARQIAAAR